MGIVSSPYAAALAISSLYATALAVSSLYAAASAWLGPGVTVPVDAAWIDDRVHMARERR